MSDLLSRDEMTSLNRALAKRTQGRVRVGPRAITVAQGIAVWNVTSAFTGETGACAPGATVRTSTDLARVLGTGTVLAVAASLAGCATLGGNIKGSFACRAPDGMCAPTSTIDDAALAMIGGDASAQPAGPYNVPAGTPRIIQTAAVEPVRSNEKVLRIVFPAHIDGAGRYRETTAIHAVVERGEWMAAGTAQALPVRTSAAQPAAASEQQLALAESMPAMRSLGELAAAAPEVRFPDPVAEIDAQNAAEVPTQPIGPVKPDAALSTKPVSRRVEASVGSGPRRRSLAPVAAPVAATTPGTAAISYTLPPKSTANPIETIRNQVAAQLRSARPMAPAAAPQALQGPGTSAKPVNGPALFPASEVNP